MTRDARKEFCRFFGGFFVRRTGTLEGSERGESSRHAAPPLPALVPLSKAGGTAVLTVSVLAGWESPGLWATSALAEAGETTPVCPLGGGGGLEDGARPRNASSSSASSSCCCCWSFNRTKLPMKDKPRALIKLRGGESITVFRGGNSSCTNNRKTISARLICHGGNHVNMAPVVKAIL